MNERLIPLAILLAALSGCPDTPPEASEEVAQALEEMVISKPADAGSAAATEASDARFESGAPAVK